MASSMPKIINPVNRLPACFRLSIKRYVTPILSKLNRLTIIFIINRNGIEMGIVSVTGGYG